MMKLRLKAANQQIELGRSYNNIFHKPKPIKDPGKRLDSQRRKILISIQKMGITFEEGIDNTIEVTMPPHIDSNLRKIAIQNLNTLSDINRILNHPSR